MKKTAIAGLLAAAFLAACGPGPAQAMGKRPGQGRVAAVSRLTPEQELRAKAEYDSIKVIYDALTQNKHTHTLDEHVNWKKELTGLLHDYTEKYERFSDSQKGELFLRDIITLRIRTKPSKDTMIGPRNYVANPNYRKHYEETMKYVERFVDEYPSSTEAERVLITAADYSSGGETIDGKYIKPYVELVKRYPNSSSASSVLYAISSSAEYDTGGHDFNTAFWAYSLWCKKYKDQLFYLNTGISEVEAFYNDKRFLKKRREEMHKNRKEIGEAFLRLVVPEIGHALVSYWDEHGSYPTVRTSDSDVLYKLLRSYFWDQDLFFKKGDFFKNYPDFKLVKFESDSLKYTIKLKLFDIIHIDGNDRSNLNYKK